ncbi:MAG TPA: hypothetical protein VG870_04635 [Chitinophagaceae bacterium]|nr:hypothetical protein [Chitinophagaceae bacterium]
MPTHEMPQPAKEAEATLRKLVDRVLSGYQSIIALHGCSLVNEIPDGFTVMADRNLLSALLEELVEVVVRCSRNTIIRITAKAYHDVILLHVKESDTENSYALLAGLQRIQPLAEQLGGFLDLTSARLRSSTIAFSFPNLPSAA